MKKWIWVIALLFSTVCFAGERNMIRNFDKNGLKDLNNQLKKQEKLIKKLQKQLGQPGVSTTTVQSTEDFVSETVLDNAGTVINTVPAVGVAREDGRLELYDTSIDEATVINIEPSSYVHQTQAKIAVPSSYFLDLRGIYLTTATQQYTADLIVLHDTDGNTITLTGLDETNNVGTAGPVAGGRDQSGAFDANSWIHFFFIYNPVTKDVSSLSSASPTAPALPTGYTFFVRIGAVYFDGSSHLVSTYQRGDMVYTTTIPIRYSMWDGGVDVGGTFESLAISYIVPPTAKTVQGLIGCTRGTGLKDVKVASASDGKIMVGGSITAGTPDVSYGLANAVPFVLPILTAQTIWWTASNTSEIYGVLITGFQDDL